MKTTKFHILFFLIIFLVGFSGQALSQEERWNFKKIWEGPIFNNSPIFLNTTADLNGNGIKELIVSDFGQFGDKAGELKRGEAPQRIFNVIVLEWNGEKMEEKWKKTWDTTLAKSAWERQKIFDYYRAANLVAWEVDGQATVESIPPFFVIKNIKGAYELETQSNKPFDFKKGSWILPWFSGTCYNPSCRNCYDHLTTIPRECLVGLRDFGGEGKPQTVSIYEYETKEGEIEQTLRIRNLDSKFAVEWEEKLPERFVWEDPIDKLNAETVYGILLRPFRSTSWYILDQSRSIFKSLERFPSLLRMAKNLFGFNFKKSGIEGGRELEQYDLPDLYLRSSREKDTHEYWGYFMEMIDSAGVKNFHLGLKRVTINPDPPGFLGEKVDFPLGPNSIGIGFFNLFDIDKDGLHELIYVEENGEIEFEDEYPSFLNVKDFIKIRKWNGEKYANMWTSPPVLSRGTKVLFEDILGVGHEQLLVLGGDGRVQIWERE